MRGNTNQPPDDSIRASQAAPVCIYFEDESINAIFSELLEARGIHTRILAAANEMQGQTRIITEPRYFPYVDESSYCRCLVIGNKESLRGLTAVTLSRPLTEEKIETALRQFLAS